jgi:hypothetical protein
MVNLKALNLTVQLNNHKKIQNNVVQAVEYMPRKGEALSSNPSTVPPKNE